MKKLIFCLTLACANFVFAEVHMTRVDASLFINKPETDFSKISFVDMELKQKAVQALFDADLLDHFGTKAYDPEAKFESYYAKQKGNFWLIDLNNDKTPEIVFSGIADPSDDREFFEIYVSVKGKYKRLIREIGHLLAYKTHPNTNEILLYHHQYPCCANASHNINRFRLVDNEFQQVRYYFIAKETDLVKPFFPEFSKFNKKSKSSKGGFSLYWSPAVVNTNAWKGRSQINRIAKYDKKSVLYVLAEQKGWLYVLVKSPPQQEQGNMVINTSNFKETGIFGWVEKKDLNN